MKTLLKYAGGVTITLVLLAVLLAAAVMFLLNPNDFKPLIVSQIKNYTHKEVAIKGDLSWSFYPDIGLKVGRVHINNIEIERTTVIIKLWPLLHKQIEILGLDLAGVRMTDSAYELSDGHIHAVGLKQNTSFPVTASGKWLLKSKNQTIKAHLETEVLYQPDKNTLLCQALTGEVADIAFKGAVKITQLTQQPVVTGKLTIPSLNASGIQLSNISLSPTFKAGVLDINPISASLYKGQLQGQVTVVTNSAAPRFYTNSAFTDVQLEPLLKDLGAGKSKFKVQGLGVMRLVVSSDGSDMQTILSHLNGSGSFQVKQGVLVGIDLVHLIDSASALARKQPTPASRADKTYFDRLKGTIGVRKGIIQNSDLILESSRFMTTGSGKIDLPSHWINYVFYTTVKQNAENSRDNWTNLYGVEVPVAIRGNLNDPSISIDAGQLLKSLAKQGIKLQIKNEIQNKLEGPAGDLLQNLLSQ